MEVPLVVGGPLLVGGSLVVTFARALAEALVVALGAALALVLGDSSTLGKPLTPLRLLLLRLNLAESLRKIAMMCYVYKRGLGMRVNRWQESTGKVKKALFVTEAATYSFHELLSISGPTIGAERRQLTYLKSIKEELGTNH